MKRRFNEEWTGYVVGKMHQFGITNAELGKYCGYTEQYVSMVLNGKKAFRTDKSKERTKNRILRALDEIVAEVSHDHNS